MKSLENYEYGEEYACYRPAGSVSLAEAVGKINDAIVFSREQGVRKLLINATKLTGFAVPTTLERFNIASALADAARSAVKVAMVLRPEVIDPKRFGVTVARNRGLFAEVFDSEKEALAWLLDPDAK